MSCISVIFPFSKNAGCEGKENSNMQHIPLSVVFSISGKSFGNEKYRLVSKVDHFLFAFVNVTHSHLPYLVLEPPWTDLLVSCFILFSSTEQTYFRIVLFKANYFCSRFCYTAGAGLQSEEKFPPKYVDQDSIADHKIHTSQFKQKGIYSRGVRRF